MAVAIKKFRLGLHRGCLRHTIYSRYRWLALLAQLQIFFSQIFFSNKIFGMKFFLNLKIFKKFLKIFEKIKNLKIFEEIKNLKIFEIFEKIKKKIEKIFGLKKNFSEKNIHPLPKCSYQPKRF